MLPTEIDPDTVDDDWISMFMEHVKNVSDEDFQLLWARILAGEFENPNSFSLRTLECLKNLNKTEALVFKDLAKYALDGYNNSYIFSKKNILTKYNIPFSNFLLMEECGLMSSQELSLNLLIGKKEDEILFFNNSILCLVTNPTDEDKKYSTEVFAFTKCGRELLNAVNVDQNNEYFLDVIREIAKDKSTKLLFSAHRINSIENDNIDYSTVDLINNEGNIN